MKSIIISIKPKWTAKILNGEKTLEIQKLKKAYLNMHSRCENPKATRYERYGGRGIKVCDEWSGENGKSNFISWALDNGYFIGASIERIDIDKGYSPSNCKWIPLSEQSANTRKTHLITHNGKTQCLEKWCKDLGLKSNTILYRAKMRNISFEEAVFNYHPYEKNSKTHCPHGHEYTEENSIINCQGYRICKTCLLEHRKEYNEKRKEQRKCQKQF